MWDFGTVRGTVRIPGGPNPPGLGLPDSGPAPLTGNGRSAPLMAAQGSNDRFGTGRSNSSAGSGGSSATGTVRMALQPQRPGIPLGQSPPAQPIHSSSSNVGRSNPSVHDVGGSTGPVSARDYAAPLQNPRSHVRTGSEIDDYADEREADELAGGHDAGPSSFGGHSRAVSTPGGAANLPPRRGSRDDDPALLLETERRRLEKMKMDPRYEMETPPMNQPHARAASSPASRPSSTHDNHLFAPSNNHSRGGSEESIGSIDSRTEEVMRRTSGNYQPQQQQPQIQHQQQASQGAAMDEVFLPVFEQLSLAVSNRPDALRAIASLRASLQTAEAVVPGLANAFAGEIFAYMSENEGTGEEEGFGHPGGNGVGHNMGAGSRLYDEEAEEEEERREREEEMERRKLHNLQQQQQQQHQPQRRNYSRG